MVTDASWYHCNVKVISRSNPPRTAVGAAAYITGTRLYDRELENLPGYEPSDYRQKSGVENWFIKAQGNVPEWTYDLETLCNEAQARDTRKNSCTARVGKAALPNSVDAEGRLEIAHRFADYLSERYQVAVVTSIHEPDRHGDDRNWHLHNWFPTRRMDENGLGAKTRELDDKVQGKAEITHIREALADIINDYLDEAGIDERIDHRSYKDRGIERTPTEHMGEAASALERKGVKTERGDRNREIRESNRKIDQLVSELAVVQAEIREEHEKEFFGTEVLTEEEIENLPSDRDEEEPPPSALPAMREPGLPQEPPPTVSIFDSPTSKMFERELREKGYIGEEFPDYPDLEEELDEPAFAEASAGKPEPEEEPGDTPTVFTESYPRMEAPPGVSIFDSPLSKWFERQIREHGEIQEYGLGKNWYDRTIAYWQDLYGGASRFIKDTWQKYVMDRDKSPDREDEGGLFDDAVDRAKSFWQKYVKGGDKDPDRDGNEPER